MIQRNRTDINIPLSILSNDCQISLYEIIDNISVGNIQEGKDKISSKFYRGEFIDESGSKFQDVVITLGLLYNHKCAFCESKRHNPEVEHYRPKKSLTGVKGHHGYYWLCYEWSNLLPCCHDCNAHKLTSFPIIVEANRVYSPTFLLNRSLQNNSNLYPLINEQPFLIHPEIDNPELYFIFNFDGEIIGIDQGGRGEKTKEICNLNRKDLIWFRQKEINNTKEFSEMALFISDDNYFIDCLNKFRERALNSSEEYTLLHKNIYNRYLEVILPILHNSIQHRAKTLYLDNCIIIE